MLINIHTHRIKNEGLEIFNLPNIQSVSAYYSVGIHPWNADSELTIVNKIIEVANGINCLAIGEIGLDKLKGPSIEIQSDIFQKQIQISEDLKLPVIIHCVRAWNELKALRKILRPKQVWIYHGFSKPSILEDVLKEGLYVSIGSEVLTNPTFQGIIADIPNDHFFIETDDADVNLIDLYHKVSELKQLTLQELEQQIEQNFKTVFRR